jgi:hypothetical protein
MSKNIHEVGELMSNTTRGVTARVRKTVTLPVRGSVASTLDVIAEIASIEEEMGDKDAPKYRLLANAYKNGALRFSADDAREIGCALSHLSETDDSIWRAIKHRDPDGARMAKEASTGFAALASKARKAEKR